MSKLKSIKGNKRETIVTQKEEMQFRPFDAYQLASFLSSVIRFNSKIKEQQAYFLNRNITVLRKLFDETKEKDKAIDEKYCLKDDKGNIIFWTREEGSEDRAIFVEDDSSPTGFYMLDVATGEKIKTNKQWWPLVENKDLEEAYKAEKLALQEEHQTVKCITIIRQAISDLDFPTSLGDGRVFDLSLFYDMLIIDENDEEDEV